MALETCPALKRTYSHRQGGTKAIGINATVPRRCSSMLDARVWRQHTQSWWQRPISCKLTAPDHCFEVSSSAAQATKDPDFETEGTAEKVGGKVQKKAGEVDKWSRSRMKLLATILIVPLAGWPSDLFRYVLPSAVISSTISIGILLNRSGISVSRPISPVLQPVPAQLLVSRHRRSRSPSQP